MQNEHSNANDPLDGLPSMIVGRWVTDEKHRILKRYIDASWAARQKFKSQRSYIDLFAGTGRVNVKHTKIFVDGGPLAAWRISQLRPGAFSDFFIADADTDSLNACKERLHACGAPVKAKVGLAHETIDWVLPQLSPRGLHLAFLDPFNAGHLHFSIIEKLANLPSIDIVVHVSTGDIQRNLSSGLVAETSTLDRFAPGWRSSVRALDSKQAQRHAFLSHWTTLVQAAGLHVCETMYPVRNSKESIMYWLCLLSRHPLADKLWRVACEARTKDLF